jgi:hypothetical protein
MPCPGWAELPYFCDGSCDSEEPFIWGDSCQFCWYGPEEEEEE